MEIEIGQGVRQGDVILIRVAQLPARRRERSRDAQGRLVVEFGESTGHAHAVLEAGAHLYDVLSEAGRIVGQALEVVEETGALLVHEEHGAKLLVPGFYERWYQRVHVGEEERRVLD